MSATSVLEQFNFRRIEITLRCAGHDYPASYFVRKGNREKPVVVLIPGFGMSPHMWADTFETHVSDSFLGESTVIVLGFPGSESGSPVPWLGWQTLHERTVLAQTIIQKACQDQCMPENAELVLCGFSLGAVIARQLLLSLHRRVKGLYLYAPVPNGWLALHTFSFWRFAIFALPAMIVSLLTGRSVSVPYHVARNGFANGNDVPELQRLGTDSSIIFLQLLFLYRGFEVHRVWKEHYWSGVFNVYLAEEDRICPLSAQDDARYEKIPHQSFLTDRSHFFWT